MLLERRTRARPTLLGLLTLSVEGASLAPDLAAATAAAAAAGTGRDFLPEFSPASPRSFAAVVVCRLSPFAVFPCQATTAAVIMPLAP